MENGKIFDDEMTLKEVIQKLRSWILYLKAYNRIIVTAGVIGSLLGLTYSYLKSPLYFATTTFVLEESGNSSGLGQYSGLASMVGIDMGGAESSGIFQGENIFELYKSRLMIEKTLLSSAIFDGRSVLLIERYIQTNKLREKWKKNKVLKSIDFAIPREEFKLSHDSIVGEIVQDIKKNFLSVEKRDKKLNVISVNVKASDERFAKAFTEKIVENVNEFYIQTKTKKSLENVKLLQKQADSVRKVLNTSIGGAASALDANPNANPALQMLRVPSQRRQIDIQAASAIYAEVVKNLEISKISLRKETPLIQVIDKPVLPLPVNKIEKLYSMVIGALMSVLLTIGALSTVKIYKNILSESE